ncbi:hypothetical protein RRG08_027474 [Elysia crispata]|uniref:Uncharacterized protein n=1 Tax=Elysia crispata TaxID=231223 RepID=A0AAE0YR18_9GAST|nr:hypothetical protein RRG08_027474 [Elysia crispata]
MTPQRLVVTSPEISALDKIASGVFRLRGVHCAMDLVQARLCPLRLASSAVSHLCAALA